MDYTILQPGTLINDAGTGKVTVNPDVGGEITRDDVATFTVQTLHTLQRSVKPLR
ncbi:hypothetical protein TUA1478L_21580 [Lactiplantibacillus plantarum]